jgi:hypothetical protein
MMIVLHCLLPILVVLVLKFNIANCFEQSTPEELYYDLPDRHCRQKVLPNVTPEELLFAESYDNVPMLSSERILLTRYLKKSKIYLEYGPGGSSELACHINNLEKIIIVDSRSQTLVNRVVLGSDCLKEISQKVLPIYVDIGRTREYGNPTRKHELAGKPWSAYPSIITTLPGGILPDFILINGRFRVACTLKILLSYHKSYPNLIFAIHDFFFRKNYHIVLQFTDIIDCIDELVILKGKPAIDYIKLAKEYDVYVKIYD